MKYLKKNMAKRLTAFSKIIVMGIIIIVIGVFYVWIAP